MQSSRPRFSSPSPSSSSSELIGFNRDSSDAFYTKPSVASDCILFLKQHINLNEFKTIIEPSAGNGSFSTLFSNDSRLQAFDINPRHQSIREADFLSVDLVLEGPTLIIGNPPFGRQSVLARKFIDRCCNSIKAEVIAFILPLSFSNQHNQKSFPLHYHLIHEYLLPPDSFLVGGKSHHVPTVFQIWRKEKTDRVLKSFTESVGFHYTSSVQPHDFAVPRFLLSNGSPNLKRETKGLRDSTHRFIKLDVSVNMDEFEQTFKQLDFPEAKNNIMKTMSKDELNSKLNQIL